MGIVVSQSIKNTITTYLGFVIGAVNTLFLYTQFIGDVYFGLVSFLLSTANIMSPLLMFGVNNALIKFYSSYKTKQEKDGFLLLMLVLPLFIIIPVGFIGVVSYEYIAEWLSSKNTLIKNYTWAIYVVAVTMAYFEVFFSWGRVHLKSVFGNLMKEVFHRLCVMGLLIAVYLKYLTVNQFIYALVIVYSVRVVIIKVYALTIYFPSFKCKIPLNSSAVLKYNVLIIIAGSVAVLLFDLDKLMLGKIMKIDNIAYYNVAVFMAFVIAVPARAMHQIISPLTATYINNNRKEDLRDLYKKSSLNLLIIGGFIFVLVVTNVNQMYLLLPPDYSKGVMVLILVALVKLLSNALGNNNAILFNSNYYRIILLLGVVIVGVAVVLNLILIPLYGINGAAMASFAAYVLYDVLKLWYVKYKMNLQPFTKNTFYVLVFILTLSIVFYYVEFPFYPLVNIAVKTVIIALVYGVVIVRSGVSQTITDLVKQFLP